MKITKFLLIMASIAIFATFGESRTGGEQLVPGSERISRPFKGRIVGRFISTPTNDSTIFTSIAHATGIATETGRFSKVTADVLNVSTGEVTGAFTMTTASGDLLSGQYSGYVVPNVTTFYWVLNATITGGSGRFTDATGEFVFYAEGNYDFENGDIYGVYTESFEGTISY